MRETCNLAGLQSSARLEALGDYLATNPVFPDFVPEANNHIHTCYSFSPYTPTAAALAGRRAGLPVVGSVDHDSIAAAGEMTSACQMLGMGVVTGFELRVFWHTAPELQAATALSGHGDFLPDGVAGQLPANDAALAEGKSLAPFAHRKLNNPDSVGVAYVTVQGVPAAGRKRVNEVLGPIRAARLQRTELMAGQANQALATAGIAGFEFTDVVESSQYAHGGSVTERHLLAAVAGAIVAHCGPNRSLTAVLAELGVALEPRVAHTLSQADNPHLLYDVLGVLKSEFLHRFYIQPSDECLDSTQVVALAEEVGAIATYAYLGDVAQSPTRDKKAENFEDSFLDELIADVARRGFRAVTYMPPRNTPAQIARISALAEKHGLLQISGVDINQPRQSFNCPELRQAELAHLNEATWALVAHEAASNLAPQLGFFHRSNPLGALSISQRQSIYAKAGRAYVLNAYNGDNLVRTLISGAQ